MKLLSLSGHSLRRKFTILFFLLCIFPFSNGKSQNFYSGNEYGINFGGSEYFGDLNEDYGFHFVRPAVGAFYRLHMNPFIALKATVNYTHIGYKDAFSNNAYQLKRNLSFQSDIVEAVIQAEFNFFRFATGETGNRWTPYLTGGIGAFYYNPYTTLNGKKYYLRNLGTEGQRAGFSERSYKKISLCFPVGAGFKYWIHPGLNIGFEIANRLTLTDYIDDVSTTYVGAEHFPNNLSVPNPAYILQDRSLEIDPENPLGRAGKQRGNSSTSDQYMMFLVQISFQLKVYKCPRYMTYSGY